MAEISKTSGNNKPQAQQNSTPIPAHQHLAVVMRYDGFTWPEVTETINGKYGMNLPQETIRNWFAHGRPLRAYYDQYAAQENEMREAMAENVFKSRLDEAVRILAAGMVGKASQTQIFAANSWLDRAVGRTIERRVNKNLNFHASLTDVIAEADAKMRKDKEEQSDGNTDPYQY